MNAALRCVDLYAGYGGRPVVRGFDLVVGEGEIVALLGPNGAGKTTLLNTLGGLLPPVAGGFEVGGAGSGRHRRSQVVLVPDDRSLFRSLTARENIVLGRRRGRAGVDEVLSWFPGLGPRLDTAAGALSGGEQQQLALARALVQDPGVLLVDELSMGLAPLVVDELSLVVRRVAEETGAAVVLVEQQTRRALELADRAVVMVHGDTVLEESAAVLRQRPELLESAFLGASGPAGD